MSFKDFVLIPVLMLCAAEGGPVIIAFYFLGLLIGWILAWLVRRSRE